MKNIFFLWIILSLSLQSQAQNTKFIASGTITYERIVNWKAIAHRVMSADGKRDEATTMAYLNQMKDQLKDFSKRTFTLKFNPNQSFYTPLDASTPEDNIIVGLGCGINERYTDFTTQKSIEKKDALGKKYIITDTLSPMKWRFTGETRDIAGYTCYRANGLLADSIYVVAFFTPQIPTASGPESFNGLPGMIMGVSIPHEHISWFASKVETQVSPVEKWEIPSAKKTIPNTEFKKNMDTFLNSIGANNGGSWLRRFFYY